MKRKYFTGKTHDEALANHPHGVPPEDWQWAVEHWSTPETQAHVSTNAATRSCAPPTTHGLGRSSIGRIKDKFASKNDGILPNRMQIYELSHTRQGCDGSWVWIHDHYRENHERMHSLVNPTSEDVASLLPEQTFTEVMPREHGGEVRCAGRGETPTT